jgi:peptidoglycan/xylan/chitin deacetylase (PgdA/CDA1 family)
MDKFRLKRNMGRFYPSAQSGKRKIILLYHAVGSGPNAMSEQLFFNQMHWLKQNCEVLSLSELLTTPCNPNMIQVALSFDDGYACLYDVCSPILENLNLSSMVYLNTGWISDNIETRCSSNPQLGHYLGENFLTWGEVEQLVVKKWEVGSHGVEHVDLTQMKRQDIQQQLTKSKKMIEEKLQIACPHFAYTWGRHSQEVRALVKQAGYQYAVAAHHREISQNSGPYVLPRMNIDKSYSLDDFIKIVKGNWDYLGLIHTAKYALNEFKKSGMDLLVD